jgi:transposase InsO family protein
MEERYQLARHALKEEVEFTVLCDIFGISTKTGYKWVHRFEEEGKKGLEDRSRAPNTHPNKTPQKIEDFIIKWRKKRPDWGATKIIQKADKVAPHLVMPSPTTVHNIIVRNGLANKKRRRTKRKHPGKPFTKPEGTNDIWTVDFKGEFKLLNGHYCYPLTIMDEYSRFMLDCQGLYNTSHDGAKEVFRRVFKEYGLPNAIKSDNGSPFASIGLGRLSRLSVWWIKLGIEPILIQPGSPYQNGKHERMHRTLKAGATKPPKANLQAQQRRFNEWLDDYNFERPHDSLGGDYPCEVYRCSKKDYPSRVPKVEYPDHYEVRLVSANKGFRWHNRYVGANSALVGEYIGLEPLVDGIWTVYFSFKRLGFLDERKLKVVDDYGRLNHNVRVTHVP